MQQMAIKGGGIRVALYMLDERRESGRWMWDGQQELYVDCIYNDLRGAHGRKSRELSISSSMGLMKRFHTSGRSGFIPVDEDLD